MPTFDPNQLSFTADAWGYMLTYRGHNIGGVALLHRTKMHWRRAQQNREDFVADAKRDIESLKQGRGPKICREAILEIDAQQETTP